MATQKTGDDKILEELALTAAKFRKTYESPQHIYKALDQLGIKDPAGRAKYMSLLSKKLSETREKKLASEKTSAELAKRKAMLNDASRHEQSHPEDAYRNDL